MVRERSSGLSKTVAEDAWNSRDPERVVSASTVRFAVTTALDESYVGVARRHTVPEGG